MNHDFITHYYLKDNPPFLSLSDLEGDTDHPVFQHYLNRHQSDDGYRRRFGLEYLNTRRKVETKLRELFIERGGKPSRAYPIYFVLGKSNWFKHLNQSHDEIQIPLSELPLDQVSITFPDSFLTLTAKDKPYFEKVYFLNEVAEMLTQYGVPKDYVPESYDNYWEGDFEHYFEVQVWDDEVLKRYTP